MVSDREAWRCSPCGWGRVGHDLATVQEQQHHLSEAREGLIPAPGFSGRVITQALDSWGREEVSNPR